MALFFCADHVQQLGGESPLHPGQGEVLAERQGCPSRDESEGSRRQSACLTKRKRIEAAQWGERAIDAKPSTCTKHREADPTGISVKTCSLCKRDGSPGKREPAAQ